MLRKKVFVFFFISFQHEFLNAFHVFGGKVPVRHLPVSWGGQGLDGTPLSPCTEGQAPAWAGGCACFQQARLPPGRPAVLFQKSVSDTLASAVACGLSDLLWRSW